MLNFSLEMVKPFGARILGRDSRWLWWSEFLLLNLGITLTQPCWLSTTSSTDTRLAKQQSQWVTAIRVWKVGSLRVLCRCYIALYITLLSLSYHTLPHGTPRASSICPQFPGAPVWVLAESEDYRGVLAGLYSEVCLARDPEASPDSEARDPKISQDSEAHARKRAFSRAERLKL